MFWFGLSQLKMLLLSDILFIRFFNDPISLLLALKDSLVLGNLVRMCTLVAAETIRTLIRTVSSKIYLLFLVDGISAILLEYLLQGSIGGDVFCRTA